MSEEPMQAKDIDDRAVLRLLADATTPGTWSKPSDASLMTSVHLAMPADTPEKVALAKMRALIRRRLVSGCPCGCRGDFAITEAGHAFLATP